MKFGMALSICAGLCGAWLYAGASNAEDALTLAKNPSLWPAPGHDLALTRHSDLKQINTLNVKHLQLAWDQSTGALRGHEGQPLVVDVDGKPTLFLFSAWPNIVQALDLSDPDYPKEIWNYVKKTDRDEFGCSARLLRHRQPRWLLWRWQDRLPDSRRLADRARRQDRQRGLGRQEQLPGQGRRRHAGSAHCRWQGLRRLRR